MEWITGRVKWVFAGLVPLAVLCGWLLTNGSAAVGTIRELRAWWLNDGALTGTWTNDGEGHVDGVSWAAQTPEELVWLSMTSTDGVIRGTIHTPRLCNFLPWNYVQLEGRNSWWGTRVIAFDHVGGRPTGAGNFKVSLDDKGFLVLDPIGTSPVFPKRAMLAKSSDAVAGDAEGVPPACENNIIQKFMRSRERAGQSGN